MLMCLCVGGGGGEEERATETGLRQQHDAPRTPNGGYRWARPDPHSGGSMSTGWWGSSMRRILMEKPVSG